MLQSQLTACNACKCCIALHGYAACLDVVIHIRQKIILQIKNFGKTTKSFCGSFKQHEARFFFYLPYLYSIHEKANCIAMLWTVCPHSLGSCYFRGVWATCLPHKGGGAPFGAFLKDTTSELAGLFSTTSH